MAKNCILCKHYIPSFEYITEPYRDANGRLVRPEVMKTEEICGRKHDSRLRNKVSCPYMEE